MKSQIEPGWLVSLMTRWVKRDIPKHVLGYPSKCPGFSEKTTGGYNHSNPTAFTAEDFTDLERALDQLRAASVQQHTAMMMYYKPWIIESMKAEGWPFQSSTYYQRLHAAHANVARDMDAMKKGDCVYTQTIEHTVDME